MTIHQALDHTLPSNSPDLTAAEQAALDNVDANGDPITTQPGAEAPDAVDDGVDAPDVPAAAPQATTSPIFTPTITPGESRDFAREVADLKEKYNAGEIDDDEYESAREAIVEARTLYNAQASIAEQMAEQAWRANVQVFLQAPENAALLRSPDMAQLWQATMNRVVNDAAAEGRSLSDWDILTAGRDRLFETIGLSTSQAPEQPAAPAKPNQSPNLRDVPPTMARAPSAAPTGAKTTAESLSAADNIQDIEAFFATQSEDQADALLRSLPGAYVE